jgi:phospholipid/cholesterol/gamma-HCH transport system substrate-binding protein
VTLSPGVFSTTALPIEGTNPTKPQGRPPLRADVPCETQEPPDLRSNVGAPPEQRRVDTSSPVFKLRYAKARTTAMDWLKRQLRRENLDGVLKVDDKDATRELIERVTSQAGAKQP